MATISELELNWRKKNEKNAKEMSIFKHCTVPYETCEGSKNALK